MPVHPPELRQISKLSVEVVSDYAGLVALESTWNRLVEEAGIDHPFLSFEWVRTWWECFGAGRELCILVLKDGSETLALAPFMLGRERFYGVGLRCLELIYNVHAPRCDFIVARRPEQVYSAIWSFLLAARRRWDVVRLCQLSAASPTLEEFCRWARRHDLLLGWWHSLDSPYLPITGTWENYQKTGFDRKHRSNLTRRFRLLGGSGAPVRLQVISGGAELEKALEDGFQIEGASWKRKAGTDIGSQPEVRRFYTKFAQRAGQRGWLRLQFLQVGEEAIAFGYSLCYRNKLYLLKDGYDPKYARYSPFNVLCSLILRDAFESGLGEFDFLGDAEAWKLEWTRNTRSHYWLYAFTNTLVPSLLHFAKFQVVPSLKQQYGFGSLRDWALGLMRLSGHRRSTS